MQTNLSRIVQAAWRPDIAAVGGMSARPVPGQRAVFAKRFARRVPARPIELSDVLAGIAAALT